MRDKRINALVLIISVSRKSINAQQSPSFYNPPQVHSKSETNQKSSPERNELIHVNNVDFAGYVESLLKNDADSEEQHFYDLSPLDDGKKWNLIETTKRLSFYSNDIDWDRTKEEYERVIQHSAISTNAQGSIRGSDNNDTYHRNLAKVDGDIFGGYEYSKGNCPKAGKGGVPCAPKNLDRLCNKYDRDSGSFEACVDACEPAICCIHSAPARTNDLAPTCNKDENCAQYNYCYIAWWKLHDTLGPHTYYMVEQTDDFFDMEGEPFNANDKDDEFTGQLFYHHWNDIDPIVEEGTLPGGKFRANRIFNDPDFWDPDDD